MALVAEGRLVGVTWGALKTTLSSALDWRARGARPWRCVSSEAAPTRRWVSGAGLATPLWGRWLLH